MSTNVLDILRVAARLNVPTIGDFVNVYHFRYGGASPQSDEDTLTDMQLRIDKLYSVCNDFFSPDADYVDINVFNFTQSRPLGSVPFSTLVSGNASGDLLPPQTAAFVRGLTGYSRNWAKKFIGPTVEGYSDSNGSIGATGVTQLNNYSAEWLSSTATQIGTWAPVVFHHAGNVWRIITSTEFNNFWATMRRRKPTVGS